MPVAKKKGAVFGIYADSPDHSAPLTTIVPTLTSPTRSSTSRRALSSLQPKPVASVHSRISPLRSVSGLKEKPLSDVPVKSKSKPKSTLEIFADPEPSRPKSLSGVSGATKRRNVPTPLVTTQSLPAPLGASTFSKRSRDLLSPLPIFSERKENDGISHQPTIRSETGQSPAKRGRITLSAADSSPAIMNSSLQRSKGARDKENVAPSISINEIEGSPATRTRSKAHVVQLDFSMTLSPLTFRDSPQRRRTEVERLIDDQLGAGRRKKQTVEEMIDQASPKITKCVNEKSDSSKSKGKGFEVLADGALADVSEAYGAKGNAPSGFTSQGQS
ncbi:uncharacterized protein L203_100365 [Cryptococcus depauperatus CBS 7841]|uniref:Uncharacterized protein n=1 Tax=Cryptococcus depauperatus CBS 7841 TaxID=1295531 RepID=A0A1E3HY56_9TREE|nr:hypothetical protein L203_05764 [Cryptococcus depauperatus CBS 7841]